MNDPQEQAGFGQTFGPVLVPALNVTKNSWTPVYPDWVDPRRMAVAAIPSVFFVAVLAAPVPTYAQAIYPDQIHRRPTGHPLTLGAPYPAQAVAEVYGQAAYYPDRIDRHLPDYTGWYARPTLDQPVPRYQWQGVFPTWIPPRRPVDEGWYAKPIDAPDVTGLQWRGVYPAWLPERRAQQPSSTVFDPFPRPDQVQVYGQAAYYPDWLPERRAQDPGWLVKPVQNPQLVPLAWAPEYPDQLLQLRRLDIGWITTAYVLQPAAPTFVAAIYPDAFPPPPASPGWQVRGLLAPSDLGRLGWRGSYPDWLQRQTPVLTPYLVVDPFPRPPAAPTYGYVVVYPDWLPPRHLVPTGLYASIIEPITPPPVTVIGVEAHTGVGQRKPFSATGELGGGGW